jgi:hypothetical protein
MISDTVILHNFVAFFFIDPEVIQILVKPRKATFQLPLRTRPRYRPRDGVSEQRVSIEPSMYVFKQKWYKSVR